MKPTIASINAVLPRLDALRNDWMVPGETGWMKPRGFLRSAIIDLDNNGNADSLTLYANGDAMYSRHYYSEGDGETSFVITPVLWEILTDEPAADHRKYRREVCRRIQEAIINYKSELADC